MSLELAPLSPPFYGNTKRGIVNLALHQAYDGFVPVSAVVCDVTVSDELGDDILLAVTQSEVTLSDAITATISLTAGGAQAAVTAGGARVAVTDELCDVTVADELGDDVLLAVVQSEAALSDAITDTVSLTAESAAVAVTAGGARVTVTDELCND